MEKFPGSLHGSDEVYCCFSTYRLAATDSIHVRGNTSNDSALLSPRAYTTASLRPRQCSTTAETIMWAFGGYPLSSHKPTTAYGTHLSLSDCYFKWFRSVRDYIPQDAAKAAVEGVPQISLMCLSQSHEWLCTPRIKIV